MSCTDGAAARGGKGAGAEPEAGGDSPECPAVEMTVCAGRTVPVPLAGICEYGGSCDKWRFKGNSCVRVVSKLDVSQVRWIVCEKAKGAWPMARLPGRCT